jgi:uncharacterized protein
MPKEFVDKKYVFSVIGVSRDPGKWGSRIYKELKSKGFIAYPINPKYDMIGNDTCYPDLASLPRKPDVVITIVPPRITEGVVKECNRLGIKKVWMQPGSESEKAIKFCKDNGIKTVANSCFVMTNLDGFSNG